MHGLTIKNYEIFGCCPCTSVYVRVVRSKKIFLLFRGKNFLQEETLC